MLATIACARQRHSSFGRTTDSITFHDGEAVEDFALQMQLLISQLTALSYTAKGEEAVAMYLRVVPS